MIAILLSMVRGRWPRSLGVLVIAMATIAVAVAWPAFVNRADAKMLATEIRHANASEVVMSARNDVSANVGIPTPPAAQSAASGSDTASTPPTAGPNNADWALQQTAVFRAPWFTTVYGTDIDVDTAFAAPGGSDKATIPIVLYRQDYCAHVVVVTGRCPVAVREVLLDTALAKRLEVGVGDALPLYGVKFTIDLWQPLKNFVTVTVVGTYRVPDENDPYWGTARYFSAASGNRGDVMPILTQPGTVDLLPHSERREAVDAVLRPAGLSASELPALRAQLDSDRFSGRIASVSTSIPTMLKRVDADRAAIRAVVPGIAVPLILLGCFMVFLVVGHAVAVRRPEIAVLRLRGVTAGDRWWLAAGESLIAVAFAIPFGILLGAPLARAVATLTVHGAPPTAVVSPHYGMLLGITVGLLLLATCAAHVRPFFTVVTDLLRRVPDRAGGWRSVPLQVAIVVLAVAAIVQLRVQAGPPSGVTLVAPALVVTAIAVLLGRLVPPVAARLGRRAIGASRSGRSRVRLGLGLGAIGLARRPGAARLLAVEAVAVGMLGFTLSAAVAAAHDRAMFVRLDLGAPRVLSVGSATPAQLLHAVRAADPSGRYAMAAVAVPQSGSLGASVIAVDAARLGTVANWPAGSDPATVAGKLTVAGAHPVVLTATTLRMEATMDWASASPIHADMYAELQPIDGSAEVIADFGALSNGRHTYSTSVPGCANGCRVVALNLVPETESIALLVVTVHALGPSDASGARPSGAASPSTTLPLTSAAAWRSVGGGAAGSEIQLSANTFGLSLIVPTANNYPDGIAVVPIAGPYPVPAVVAGDRRPISLVGVDGTPVAVHVADTVPTLPRVANDGVVVDLNDLVLASARLTSFLPAEVWLAPDARPSVLTALSANGLRIVSDRTELAEGDYLADQGPAVGVAYALAASLGLLVLAAVCVALLFGVERTERTAELRALRVQGLSTSAARRSVIVGHVGLACAAAVVGLLAAVAAWALTIDRLPVFVDTARSGLTVRDLPVWALAAGIAIGAVLLAAVSLSGAFAVGRRLRLENDDARERSGGRAAP